MFHVRISLEKLKIHVGLFATSPLAQLIVWIQNAFAKKITTVEKLHEVLKVRLAGKYDGGAGDDSDYEGWPEGAEE